MTEQELEEARLKLCAYQAATTACSTHRRAYHAMSMGNADGPTVGEIKTEAERLWGWMIEKPKKPEQSAHEIIADMRRARVMSDAPSDTFNGA